MVSEAQRQHFKMALEAKRNELASAIRSQAAELAVGDGAHDPIDQVQNMAYRDQAVGNVRRLSQTLSSVERSLHAIAKGGYGCCAGCGEAIALKRLDIIPWATHCVACQSRAEQRQGTGNTWAEPPHRPGRDREAA
jgi:DnaK suppressor protein